LDHLALVEVPLLDRLYTWSSKRDAPTLSRIDRVLANNAQPSPTPPSHLSHALPQITHHSFSRSAPTSQNPLSSALRMHGYTTPSSFLLFSQRG
jgi:hypothetical protein